MTCPDLPDSTHAGAYRSAVFTIPPDACVVPASAWDRPQAAVSNPEPFSPRYFIPAARLASNASARRFCANAMFDSDLEYDTRENFTWWRGSASNILGEALIEIAARGVRLPSSLNLPSTNIGPVP